MFPSELYIIHQNCSTTSFQLSKLLKIISLNHPELLFISPIPSPSLFLLIQINSPGISESNSDNYQFIAFQLQIQPLYLLPKDTSGSFECFRFDCCHDIKVCLERILERQDRNKGSMVCLYGRLLHLSSFSSGQLPQDL